MIEPPSLEAKTKFGSNLFRLSGVQLGHVLQVLDLRCPRALERPVSANSNEPNSTTNGFPPSNNNGEEVEINVDAMDLRTFYELDAYVKDRISKSRKKNINTSAVDKDDLGTHHGPSSLENLSSPYRTGASGGANFDADADNTYSFYSPSGGRSSSSKKIGKRKR